MRTVLYKYMSVTAIALMLFPLVAMAQSRYIPARTQILLRLNTPISTEVNRPGDPFKATVITPPRYEGAIVRGHIAGIERSGRLTGRTEMGLAFDAMEFTDGDTAPLNAQLVDVQQSESVKMVDEEGNIISGSRGHQAIRRGGIGALAGGVIGGLIGGGRGLAIGLVAGGAAGSGSLYFDRGKELRLEPGAEMDIEVVTSSEAISGGPAAYDRAMVMQVQRALRDEGYYTGPVNGVLDWRTRSAIAQFQSDNNLGVTRTIDRATANMLGVRY